MNQGFRWIRIIKTSYRVKYRMTLSQRKTLTPFFMIITKKDEPRGGKK